MTGMPQRVAAPKFKKDLRCHRCSRWDHGRAPDALPLGWEPILVNNPIGRGSAFRALCFRCAGVGR